MVMNVYLLCVGCGTDLLNKHSALEFETLGLETQLVEARDSNMQLQVYLLRVMCADYMLAVS